MISGSIKILLGFVSYQLLQVPWLFFSSLVALVAIISILYLVQLQSIKKDVLNKARKRQHSA